MTQITTYYKGDMLCQSKIGDYGVLADMPTSMGGKDRAPTPTEYFIASLGMCVCASVALYCENNGIATDGMVVNIDYSLSEHSMQLVDLVATVSIPHATFHEQQDAIRQVAEECLQERVPAGSRLIFLDEKHLLDAQEAEGREVFNI